MQIQELRCAILRSIRDLLGQFVLRLARFTVLRGGRGGLLQHVGDHGRDLVHVRSGEAPRRQSRGAEPDARGVPGAVGVVGHRVAVGDDAGME